MKSTLLFTAVMAAYAGAQTVTSEGPFTLVTVSDNSTINNLSLTACHTGAAIESLCTYKASSPSQFHFNYTTYSGNTQTPPPGGVTGILGYVLPSTSFYTPEAMHIQLDSATNVGLPLFFPGNETVTYVAFDGNGFMNLQSYVDDTVSPPNGTGGSKSYYRWYICQTYNQGYTYQTLTWTYGKAPPQNPSCIKTDVKRVFV